MCVLAVTALKLQGEQGRGGVPLKQPHLQKVRGRGGKKRRGRMTGNGADCYCLKCLPLLAVYLLLIDLSDINSLRTHSHAAVFIEIRARKLEREV